MSDKPEYLRVKTDVGAHITIPADQFDEKAHELLDMSPYDHHGDLRGPTPKTSIGTASVDKAAKSVDQKKEN